MDYGNCEVMYCARTEPVFCEPGVGTGESRKDS